MKSRYICKIEVTSAIHLIAAARPNFMKVAPLYHALSKEDWCRPIIVHTGQHYDANMSDAFFADLALPKPDIHLGVGSASHAEQTAGVMIAYERVCIESKPDLVVVVGDVNSTMACTIAAKKLNLRVAHLEAGLRSGDRSMPEEINLLVTDTLADMLWTPSPDADENLRREGISPEKIIRVGNIMIDSYEMLRPKIAKREMPRELGLTEYGLVTLHRPSNVDDEPTLKDIVERLIEISNRLPLAFPIHPRTRARLESFGLMQKLAASIAIMEPMGYIDFMSLVEKARLIITDSGGVQEETTYLNIPCLTLRENTERPITVTEGTNQLVRLEHLNAAVDEILNGVTPAGRRPELWDGHTAERIVASLRP